MVNLINAERIAVSYGTRTLLDPMSLGEADGDAIGVVGRSGDAKTTLLTTLAGVRSPDRGRVTRLTSKEMASVATAARRMAVTMAWPSRWC